MKVFCWNRLALEVYQTETIQSQWTTTSGCELNSWHFMVTRVVTVVMFHKLRKQLDLLLCWQWNVIFGLHKPACTKWEHGELSILIEDFRVLRGVWVSWSSWQGIFWQGGWSSAFSSLWVTGDRYGKYARLPTTERMPWRLWKRKM